MVLTLCGNMITPPESNSEGLGWGPRIYILSGVLPGVGWSVLLRGQALSFQDKSGVLSEPILGLSFLMKSGEDGKGERRVIGVEGWGCEQPINQFPPQPETVIAGRTHPSHANSLQLQQEASPANVNKTA